MNAGGKYSRVYWEILDDAKFADVYDDDRLLATWLRLLIVADMAHPATPTVPVGTVRKALEALAEAGILELVGSTRYRVVGLTAERERRSLAARMAADARWQAPGRPEVPQTATVRGARPEVPRNAPAMRAHSASTTAPDAAALLDEHRRDETRRDEQGAAHDDPDPADTWYRITGSFPSGNVLRWLGELGEAHGDDVVCRELAAEAIVDGDRRTLLSRTQSRLEKRAHDRRRAADRAAAEREAEERRRIAEMPPEQRAANLRRLGEMLRGSGLIGPEDA